MSLQNIKITWSKAKTSDMYREGYKYCGECRYMIKVNDYRCRNCKKVFRTRPRSASNIFSLITESIFEPITINIKGFSK